MTILDLDGRPATRRAVLADLFAHRALLRSLVLTEFTVRYKRAALGVVWLVAVPLVQSALLVAILAKARAFGDVPDFGAYVLSGLLPWAYLSTVVADGGTAIVSGASLAERIWFPRALLPLVAPFSNLAALAVSMVVLLVGLPLTGVPLSGRLLLLVPACALLVAFAAALCLVLAVLHVYLRDVRHLIASGLVLWFYASPVFYPRSMLGDWAWVLLLNPATGVLDVFRAASVPSADESVRAVIIAFGWTAALLLLALEVYRRTDRTLADQL